MASGFVHIFVIATAALLLPGITAFVPQSSCGRLRTNSVPLEAAVSSSGTENAEEAKAGLRRALEESRGSSKAPGVEEAAEVLAAFNPTTSPAKAWHLHSGEWLSIGEDFKGTTRTADGLECTLGRLLFNIFEPVGLPVLLTEIQNVIGPRPENADPTDESAYKICTRWVSRDGSGLKGRTELEGLCSEDPSNPNRILVVLNKGSIRPDEGQELESWSEVIGVKDAEADKEKGPLSIIKEGFAKLVLKVAFGFRGPADSLGPGGELSYEMKRSPKALLDILYMDEELRVTRGAQGALVITSRL